MKYDVGLFSVIVSIGVVCLGDDCDDIAVFEYVYFLLHNKYL